jgi:hypothetical protein
MLRTKVIVEGEEANRENKSQNKETRLTFTVALLQENATNFIISNVSLPINFAENFQITQARL